MNSTEWQNTWEIFDSHTECEYWGGLHKPSVVGILMAPCGSGHLMLATKYFWCVSHAHDRIVLPHSLESGVAMPLAWVNNVGIDVGLKFKI